MEKLLEWVEAQAQIGEINAQMAEVKAAVNEATMAAGPASAPADIDGLDKLEEAMGDRF